MIVLAGISVAVAIWLLVGPAPSRRFSKVLDVSEADVINPARQRVTTMVGHIAAALLGAAAIALVGGPALLLRLVPVAAIGLTVWWVLQGARARKRADKHRKDVVAACQTIAGQLRIGLIPARALEVATQDCAVIEPVSAAQRIGGNVPEALLVQSRQAGCEGLETLAGAWSLSEKTGAPMAEVATLVADGLRADMRIKAMVTTELAAARASGQLLAFLPLIGIAMAAGIGADPQKFLLHNLIGQACLAGAAVLACAGVVWTEVMANNAQRAR